MHVKLHPPMHLFPSCYGPEVFPWEPGPCQLLLDDHLVLGSVTCHNPGAQQLHGTFTPVWDAERFSEELALLRNGLNEEAQEQLHQRRLRLQSRGATFYPRALHIQGTAITWTAP